MNQEDIKVMRDQFGVFKRYFDNKVDKKVLNQFLDLVQTPEFQETGLGNAGFQKGDECFEFGDEERNLAFGYSHLDKKFFCSSEIDNFDCDSLKEAFEKYLELRAR